MAGNSAAHGGSVTSKIVAILLTFHYGNEHSLSEIARLACMPLSTAHRLVGELADWGLLERTDGSRYRIGLPIRTIGSQSYYPPAVVESARRVLEDLAEVTRTSARLGVLSETGIAYVEKRGDGSPVTRFAQTPKLPAHATALGKALLAFSGPEILDRVIAAGLKGFTTNTLTDPQQLRQHLDGIRRTRVAVSRWELVPGLSAVAVPVFGPGGFAVAALELATADLRSDVQMASAVLTVAARALSRELAAHSRLLRARRGAGQAKESRPSLLSDSEVPKRIFPVSMPRNGKGTGDRRRLAERYAPQVTAS